MSVDLGIFASLAEANANLKPLVDSIEQIMELSDDLLNPNSVQLFNTTIRDAFNESVQKDMIKEVITVYENEHLSKEAVKQSMEQTNEFLKTALDDLNPSPYKRQMIENIFAVFQDIFDQALERYHSYAFELPIKLGDGGQLPTYAHETDACADIYAAKDIIVPAHSLSTIVPTELRIALPEGWVAKIAPRSSIGMKTGLRLSNSIGIIDSGYTGEIGVLYDNLSDSDYEIKAGDRIAQMWVERVERFKPVTVDILPATERGEGGFGSSGK